jgi:hypothetical protein
MQKYIQTGNYNKKNNKGNPPVPEKGPKRKNQIFPDNA